MAWQNPHVHFIVRAADPSGKMQTWDIEANSLSILRRTDATPENLKVGDTIKVAGSPSRRAPNRMWAMNILAANGREIVLGPGIKPRWQTAASGSKSTWFEGGTAANKAAGLFRVWSTKFNEPGGLWRRDYPLTDAAKKSRAAFNPLTDTVAPGCRPKGMPTIMEQPYPMEFVREGRCDPVTPRGVRHCSHDRHGARGQGRLTAKDAPRPIDRTLVNYTMTITDPATFTSPLELSRSWVWRPDETVKPYNCVEAGFLRR